MKDSVYIVTKEMLTQRGYNNIKELAQEYENQPFMLEAVLESGKTICVIFADEIKINTERAQEYCSFVDEKEFDSCIIVYNMNITPKAKQAFMETEKRFELFEEHELKFNITKHSLVPHYTKLTKSEQAELTKRVSLKHMHKMKFDDPIARFYRYDKGDVIKVQDRDDGTVLYRVIQ